MDSLEQMLSMLLDGAVEVLDISPNLYDDAVTRYEEVGDWLAEHGNPGLQIYPQGSFRLGTVVRPSTPKGEYDIDLVCLLPIQPRSTTQDNLKQRIGERLADYWIWKQSQGHHDGPTDLIARRRCWTLVYDGFHLDVLPSVPDPEHRPDGILLTDKDLREWQHSNPIGYAQWFQQRSELARTVLEKRAANVAKVPDWQFRSPLQRLVQILKWHCMIMFEGDPDNRPPSILITTLAGRAYTGVEDLFTATRGVLHHMPEFIEPRNGRWWVANPAHPEENFTDKWNEYPERRKAFYAWLKEITTTMNELAGMHGQGMKKVAERMAKSFAAEPVERSVLRFAATMGAATDLRMGSTGNLSPTASGPRKPAHTFHGQPASPRG